MILPGSGAAAAKSPDRVAVASSHSLHALPSRRILALPPPAAPRSPPTWPRPRVELAVDPVHQLHVRAGQHHWGMGVGGRRACGCVGWCQRPSECKCRCKVRPSGDQISSSSTPAPVNSRSANKLCSLHSFSTRTLGMPLAMPFRPTPPHTTHHPRPAQPPNRRPPPPPAGPAGACGWWLAMGTSEGSG